MATIAFNDDFQKVIEENKGIIYKIANAYCRDAEDRKDLVQEIIIQIWRSFSNYNDQYKLSTWIYRIALNVAISFYRRNAKRQKQVVPLPDRVLSFADKGQNEEMKEEINLLYQFINELKELDKALMLLYLEEKSHQEMAEILGISNTNVATKISRIKSRLRKRFSNQKNER